MKYNSGHIKILRKRVALALLCSRSLLADVAPVPKKYMINAMKYITVKPA
jgi:hypothetical protein